MIVALNVVLAISAAALWSSFSGPKKAEKIRKGAIRQRHDEYEIEPKDIRSSSRLGTSNQY